MKIEITLDTENAAFYEDEHYEIVLCLWRINDKIAMGAVSGGVQDTNGNTVGSFQVRK